MNAGQRVRLINDPGRVGILTGRTLERVGLTRWEVQFPDGASYVPEDQLEVLAEVPEHPVELMRRGRLGLAADLRRTLTHVRVTGRLANIIYSMDMTGTDFYAYQFKPIVKLLNSPTTGLLIADEVGLGKTIEAGLLWTELRSRFDFRRLFVLCPAVLREKWKRELRNRFGVEADILGAADVLARLREAADRSAVTGFALVASMQGLRPPRGWENPEENGGPTLELARLLQAQQHEDPLIDLLVVDEAHYMRNPETMTTDLGRLLRGVTQYVALLSATPIHLRSRDLFQLLNLTDGDLFNRPNFFDELLEANAPLVYLREQVLAGRTTPESFVEAVRHAAASPFLKGSRQLQALLEPSPTAEQLRDKKHVSHLVHRLENVNLLGHVLTRTRKREVTEWRVIRQPVPEMVPLSPVEEQFYLAVTEVVREYAGRRNAHEGFLLVTPQRQMSSCMAAALRFWQDRGAPSEEEMFEDSGAIGQEYPEPGPLVQELIARTRGLGDYQTLRRHDSKYGRLRDLLVAHLQEHPGEKVVLFAYFRATLRYLSERLGEDGIPAIILQGGEEDKEGIIEEFRKPEGPAVLLSSEIGSEGIDLQFSRVVVNYDLPWNPMRVEQRIGRLDRLGQKADRITIWNLFYAKTIDARIYDRLYRRLQIFTRTLGGLEPILGDQIQQLTLSLLRDRLTPEQQQERIDQTALAIENTLRHEEQLEEEARHLVAFGDFILNEIKAARELSRRITAADLRRYVIDFLREHYPGSEVRQDPDDEDRFRISLSNAARHDLDRYARTRRLEAQTRLTRNDLQSVECRFENTAVVRRDSRVEIISQLHPLVRFVGERLGEPGALQYPAVAVRVRQEVLPRRLPAGTYVFGVQRWSVTGLQSIERLYCTAIRFGPDPDRLDPDDAERLVTTAAAEGKDWLAAPASVDLDEAARLANEECLAEADRAYAEFVRDRRNQNEDRADIQERAADAHFRSRLESLTAVRDRHQRLGRLGLVRATEGQIAALRRWAEREKQKISEGRRLSDRKDEVCVGLICVEGEGA
jgi:superfamily II DNA or RNA helicase